MAAPKRSKAQREIDREFVAECVLRGMSSRQIAAAISCRRPYTLSKTTIEHDINTLKARWRKSQGESIQEHIGMQLERLALVRREAMEQWERSKLDRERIETHGVQATQGKDGEVESASHLEKFTREGKSGNPTYLDVVLKCDKREAELLGLDAPRRTEHTGPAGGPIDINNSGTIKHDLDKLTDEYGIAFECARQRMLGGGDGSGDVPPGGCDTQ